MSKFKLLILSLLFLALAIFFFSSAETRYTWFGEIALVLSFISFYWYKALVRRDDRILAAAKKNRESTPAPQSETPASDNRRLFVPPSLPEK